MNFLQNTLISGLEYIRDKLEEQDTDLQKRQRIFSEQPLESDKSENRSTGSSEENSDDMQVKECKMKVVSYELLDIAYYYGESGFSKAQEYQIYKLADSYISFNEKYQWMHQTATVTFSNYQNL